MLTVKLLTIFIFTFFVDDSTIIYRYFCIFVSELYEIST